MADHSTVRTRFAPSPSGHLHVGGARTALFCWAYARAKGGKFILRIEDTDQKRSSDAAAMAFLEDLEWLGIEWDEGPEYEGCGGGAAGPYHQSQRLEIYEEHLERLIASGAAYRAFETPEEIDAQRAAARAAKVDYRYDRAALELDPATVAQWIEEGRPHVVRFKVPEGDVVIQDAVVGEVTTSSQALDDFVIRKADGYPTYHFAVVVDDELMGVTHVIRAQEHLSNTPRHVLLQEALGFRRPAYAHTSLIFGTDGSKMSKRDKDKVLRRTVRERSVEASAVIDAETWAWWREKSDHQLDLDDAERLAVELGVDLPEINVDDFRRAGYLPEVLVNYLALLGWSPGEDIEQFDTDFLLERFDLDRMIKSPAKFDRDKLLAFNLHAIQAMTDETFAQRFDAYARQDAPAFIDAFLARYSADALAQYARINRERSKTLADPVRGSAMFLIDDDDIVYEQTKAVRKALVKGDPNGYAHLEAIVPVLEGMTDWTVTALESTIQAYAETHAAGRLGSVAQPLRVAVSGGPVSPAIFDTLELLGRDRVLRRIERCLAAREQLSGTA